MTYDEITKLKHMTAAIDALHRVTRSNGGFDFNALRAFFDNPAIEQSQKRGLAETIGYRLEAVCEDLRQDLIRTLDAMGENGAFLGVQLPAPGSDEGFARPGEHPPV